MPNEKVRFFRVPDMSDVELYQTNGTSRSVPRHVHSVLSASVIVAGRRIHETRQAKYTAQTGNILIVNVGEMHSNCSNGVATSTSAVRILPAFLTRRAAEITGRSDGYFPLREPVIQDRELALQLLKTQSVLETSFSRLEKEERILEFVYNLYSRHSGESCREPGLGRENKPIARACEYLQTCTETNVSLEMLADIAGLSPFYFSRVFARTMGVPPHQYQLQTRLQKATDLLAAGHSVIDVAFATGFCDQSHLQKVFKKKYGITPGQYGC